MNNLTLYSSMLIYSTNGQIMPTNSRFCRVGYLSTFSCNDKHENNFQSNKSQPHHTRQSKMLTKHLSDPKQLSALQCYDEILNKNNLLVSVYNNKYEPCRCFLKLLWWNHFEFVKKFQNYLEAFSKNNRNEKIKISSYTQSN